MEQYATGDYDNFFHLLGGTDRSQAATMVLHCGQSTGGPSNRHVRADQWLFVVSGRGRAVVEGAEVMLEAGTLVLIEANEAHEISAHGDQPLVTVNVYAPQVY